MNLEEYKNKTENYYIYKAVEYQQKYNLKITPDTLGHNDETDAFRHAFMQGSFTWKARATGKTGSYDITKYIGDDHEKDANKSQNMSIEQWRKEKNMDLWNNEIGRQTALSLERRLGPKYYTMSQKEFEDMLATELVKQIRSCKLITGLDDKRNYKDSPKNPYSDESKTNSTKTSPFNTNSKAGQVFASYEDGLWYSTNPMRDLQQQSPQQGNGKYANIQKNAMFERLGIEDMHAKYGHLANGPWVKDNYPIPGGNEWVHNSMTGNVLGGRGTNGSNWTQNSGTSNSPSVNRQLINQNPPPSITQASTVTLTDKQKLNIILALIGQGYSLGAAQDAVNAYMDGYNYNIFDNTGGGISGGIMDPNNPGNYLPGSYVGP